MGNSSPLNTHGDAGRGFLHSCLALARVSFLRTVEKRLLVDVFPDALTVFSLSKEDLASLVGRRIPRAEWEPSRYLREAEKDIEILDRGTIKVLLLHDEQYPPQLRELCDAPILLFYRGRLPDPTKPLVGVVGTRRPTGAGRAAALRLGRELSSLGLGVVSGLARGIDAEAHRGCLMGSAPAVAVLGNGLNSIYPRSSVELGREILRRGGALVSEYSPDTPPRKYQFPARNRIISGLSRSVVVIQAPERSGALITADHALNQGRDLFVHRVGVTGAASGGSADLVNDGAEVISSGREILSNWGWSVPQPIDSEIYAAGEDSQRDTGKRLAELLELELANRTASPEAKDRGKDTRGSRM